MYKLHIHTYDSLCILFSICIAYCTIKNSFIAYEISFVLFMIPFCCFLSSPDLFFFFLMYFYPLLIHVLRATEFKFCELMSH